LVKWKIGYFQRVKVDEGEKRYLQQGMLDEGEDMVLAVRNTLVSRRHGSACKECLKKYKT
jgi:hypothetical protein